MSYRTNHSTDNGSAAATAGRVARGTFAVMLLIVIGGCAKAEVNTTRSAGHNLKQPDHLVVYDFAVTSNQVQLDRGAMAKVVRGVGGKAQTDEEIKIGQMVAQALSVKLVEELRKSGIPASRAGLSPPPTDRTVEIQGQFVQVDQGNQSARVWLGFGLGGTSLRTQLQAYQGVGTTRRFIAEAQTNTRGSLKPGMLTSLGVGAATDNVGRAAAIGAGTTTASELLDSNVKADAERTAKEIAKRIRKVYSDRGWR